MTSKDLDRLNRDIEILYRYKLKEGYASIGRLLGLSDTQVKSIALRCNKDKRLLAAVELRMKERGLCEQFEDCS